MAITLNKKEVDAFVSFFRGDERFIAIAANYISRVENETQHTVASILRRCKRDQETR